MVELFGEMRGTRWLWLYGSTCRLSTVMELYDGAGASEIHMAASYCSAPPWRNLSPQTGIGAALRTGSWISGESGIT